MSRKIALGFLLCLMLSLPVFRIVAEEEPQPPQAAFSWSPEYPYVNEMVTFNASDSMPNGGEIVSYAWDFGDGTPIITEIDPIIDHVYTAAGTYIVTLNVTDGEGLWSTESKNVDVLGPEYTVTLTVTSTVTGETYFTRTFEGQEEDTTIKVPEPIYDSIVSQFGTDAFTTPFSVIICDTLNFTVTSEPTGLTITYKPKDNGDIDDNDTVDIFDLISIGVTFGSTLGAPDYDLLADLDFDFDIDIFDLIIIGVSFGDTYYCVTVTVEGIMEIDVELTPEQEGPYPITIPLTNFTGSLPRWIEPGTHAARFEGEARISETEIWFTGKIKYDNAYETWTLFKVANTYSELPVGTYNAKGDLTAIITPKQS